ncbi:hypothetical protein H5124_19785 [Pseudoalteromonas sp. SG44-4]|nr:hypothetical protein [Pseudoalteromonas sp. SG44-4]
MKIKIVSQWVDDNGLLSNGGKPLSPCMVFISTNKPLKHPYPFQNTN